MIQNHEDDEDGEGGYHHEGAEDDEDEDQHDEDDSASRGCAGEASGALDDDGDQLQRDSIRHFDFEVDLELEFEMMKLIRQFVQLLKSKQAPQRQVAPHSMM